MSASSPASAHVLHVLRQRGTGFAAAGSVHDRSPAVARPRDLLFSSRSATPLLSRDAIDDMASNEASSTGTGGLIPSTFPLVGRTAELAALEALLDGRDRPASAVLLCGEGGSGKSRLAAELKRRAERRGMTVAWGRAYPVERGVPFALFADAFLPILRAMDPGTLTVLSRGGEDDLHYLFPALGTGVHDGTSASTGDPDEFRTRLFWNFGEFLKGYAARAPLLLILEDLQWADASSMELIHFIARQSVGQPIFLLCTYNETERERSPHVVRIERSLVSLGSAEVHRLEPLSRDDITEMVCRTFGVDADVVREFSAMLYGWTRGNPSFAEEVLKSLVANGRLVGRRGTWVGWDAVDFALPGSVRDAVVESLATFSEDAQLTAELAAVIGTRASYPLLASISGLSEEALLSALDELCAHRILTERADGETVVYDFRHPLVRETLYQEFGLQRSRVLHGAVAEAMETYWGDAALEHADELAYHFARTGAANLTAKAVTYLAAAGRRALERHADREAADYLRAALERAQSPGAGEDARAARPGLLRDLARAHRRLGEYEAALELWTAALPEAPVGTREHAALRRRAALACMWCGRADDARRHLDEGLASAQAAGCEAEQVQLRLVRSHCLQELGLGGDAQQEAFAALPVAERLGDPRLLGRVHRSLALLHVWTGPPSAAVQHAERAIEIARAAGDLSVEFWARWGLAVLGGMTGDTARMAAGISEATNIANALRSPVLRLWTAEMSIELAYASGDWSTGVTLGEQSISLARSLNQKALLPRLLMLTSLFYEGRGDLDRARALVEEACEVSGMNGEGPTDVHLVVPAYMGLAHYHVAVGDYPSAIAAAREGLEIAEGTGYTLWAVHRLLPILAEACLWAGEIDEAERVGRRMREHATAMDHKLGLAWADACDALVRWKRGDPAGGALAMRQAAEALEKIPMVPYAVRIRRQLAGRLAEIGDVEGSVAELRRVHEILAQLGAELELEKARIQFREVGHRPPPRGIGEGMAGLTARELEISRLVALRRSNKAIGKDLGISPRTVSTHLSNIFQKLDLTSRAELGDVIRERGLLEG